MTSAAELSSEPEQLTVTFDGDVVRATGPLLCETVNLLLIAIGFLRSWGVTEIVVDLIGVHEADVLSVAALAAEQQRANSSGWSLKIRAGRHLRGLLEGCTVEPHGTFDSASTQARRARLINGSHSI